MSRPRGCIVYKMPQEVGGPAAFGSYALAVRGDVARMIHHEGVAYLVTADKPWCWTDYQPDAPRFTVDQLKGYIDEANAIDLADWVRDHNARTDSNFAQIYYWINDEL